MVTQSNQAPKDYETMEMYVAKQQLKYFFLVIISIFSIAFLPMMLNGKIILNSGDAVVYGADTLPTWKGYKKGNRNSIRWGY